MWATVPRNENDNKNELDCVRRFKKESFKNDLNKNSLKEATVSVANNLKTFVTMSLNEGVDKTPGRKMYKECMKDAKEQSNESYRIKTKKFNDLESIGGGLTTRPSVLTFSLQPPPLTIKNEYRRLYIILLGIKMAKRNVEKENNKRQSQFIHVTRRNAISKIILILNLPPITSVKNELTIREQKQKKKMMKFRLYFTPYFCLYVCTY